MPPRAIVFDMDGTLVDSEPLYFEADRAFLAAYGIVYDGPFRDRMMGRGIAEFFRCIEVEYPDSPLNELPLERRVELKDENYLSWAMLRMKAFPRMRAFFDLARGAGIPVAVASSSSPTVIRATLQASGYAGAFRALVSGQEVARSKPEPDVFLEAARRLGAEPARCLVVEDSAAGVIAALAAGMACIAVPTLTGGPLDPAFSRASLLFPHGMEGFDPEAAFSWASGLN